MVNYQNGKIYVLKRTTNDKTFYVGSTVNPLYKRLNGHRASLTSKHKHLLVYKYINKKGGKDAFYIELYKRYPCASKEELTKMEGRIIRRLKGEGIKLRNERIAGRTKREYAQTDKAKEYQKAYKKTDKFKEYQTNYNNKMITCECGRRTSQGGLSHHKKTAKHQLLIAEQNE